MPKPIEQLAQQLDIQIPNPVPEIELAQFEVEVGFKLPLSLRDLYSTCDGLVLRPNWLKIPTLNEVRTQWIPGFKNYGIPQVRNYFPFIDNNDSNPFCVCCDDIMSGYIVQVFHDDIARLKFRTLDAFLATLCSHLRQDKWDLHNLPPEMNKPQRITKDIETGRQLLRQAQQLEDVERYDAFRFGIRLLSADQIDEIIPFLDSDELYVCEAAQERLGTMDTPAALQALHNFRRKLDDFTWQCAEKLTNAGITVTKIDSETYHMRLDPGPVWLDMTTFYVMRKKHNDIYAFVLQRATTFLETK